MTIETQVLLQQQLQNEEGVELDAQNLVAISKGVNWRNPPLGAVVIAYGVRYEVVPPVRGMRCAWRWHAPDSDAGSIDPGLHTRSKAWFDEEVDCREEHTKSLVKKDKGFSISISATTGPRYRSDEVEAIAANEAAKLSPQGRLFQQEISRGKQFDVCGSVAMEKGVNWRDPPTGSVVIAYGKRYEVARASESNLTDLMVCAQWGRTSNPSNLLRWSAEQFGKRYLALPTVVAALIECPFSTDTEGLLPGDNPVFSKGKPNVFIQPQQGIFSFECLGVKMTRTFVEKVEIGQVIVAAGAKWGNPLDPSSCCDDFASVLEATVVLTPYKVKAWLLGWEEGSQTASSLAAYEASVPIRHIEGPPQKLPFIYIKRTEADLLQGPQWISKGCPDDLTPLPQDASPLVTHVWVIDGARLQAVHLAHYPSLRPFLSRAWSQAVKAKIKARQVQGYLPCSEKRVYCESQYADDDEL